MVVQYTFSLPIRSSRPQEVAFFENIIDVTKKVYGENKVKVVDMAKLSTEEEAMLILDTAVLFYWRRIIFTLLSAAIEDS